MPLKHRARRASAPAPRIASGPPISGSRLALLSGSPPRCTHPSAHYGFISFDDSAYVFENPYVIGGLTVDELRPGVDAARGGDLAAPCAFYAPLTTLSHMLDCQLFGLNPGPHHLGNVVFHVLNTLLLFGCSRA